MGANPYDACKEIDPTGKSPCLRAHREVGITGRTRRLESRASLPGLRPDPSLPFSAAEVLARFIWDARSRSCRSTFRARARSIVTMSTVGARSFRHRPTPTRLRRPTSFARSAPSAQSRDERSNAGECALHGALCPMLLEPATSVGRNSARVARKCFRQ